MAWQHVIDTFTHECDLRGFKPISTPTIEHTDLFSRTTGEETDIVRKEMYSFDDKNKASLTLRPEGTAGCVRAGVEHALFHNKTQIKKMKAETMLNTINVCNSLCIEIIYPWDD